MKNQITALEVIQDLHLMLHKELQALYEKKVTLDDDVFATIGQLVRVSSMISEARTITGFLNDYAEKLGFSEEQMWKKINEERG